VPPHAAELFRNSIAGVDAFFQQNQSIYFIDQRPLNSITGIRVVDESTIEFTLNKPDPYFLTALAHPHASVYPRDSFRPTGRNLHGHPVGTGLFKMSYMSGDSLLTLERHFRHYAPELADKNITSLNINVHKSESTLFRKLATEQIQALPELGPQTTQTMLKTDQTLMPTYHETYRLYNRGNQSFYLHFFPDATYPLSTAKLNEFQTILSDTKFEGISGAEIHDYNLDLHVSDDNKKLNIGYVPHPFIFHAARVAVSNLMDTFDIKMYLAQRPNIDMTFFWSDESEIGEALLLKSFEHYNYALTHKKSGEILFNRHPWWMSFEQYTTRETPEL
jgi:ABC-type transport system substrate-binding protein